MTTLAPPPSSLPRAYAQLSRWTGLGGRINRVHPGWRDPVRAPRGTWQQRLKADVPKCSVASVRNDWLLNCWRSASADVFGLGCDVAASRVRYWGRDVAVTPQLRAQLRHGRLDLEARALARHEAARGRNAGIAAAAWLGAALGACVLLQSARLALALVDVGVSVVLCCEAAAIALVFFALLEPCRQIQAASQRRQQAALRRAHAAAAEHSCAALAEAFAGRYCGDGGAALTAACRERSLAAAVQLARRGPLALDFDILWHRLAAEPVAPPGAVRVLRQVCAAVALSAGEPASPLCVSLVGFSWSLTGMRRLPRAERAAVDAMLGLTHQLDLMFHNRYVTELLGVQGAQIRPPAACDPVADQGLLRGGWLGALISGPTAARCARARQALGEQSLTAVFDGLVARARGGSWRARASLTVLVHEALGTPRATALPALRTACRRRQLGVHPDRQRGLTAADAAVASEASRLLSSISALLTAPLGADLFTASARPSPPGAAGARLAAPIARLAQA